MRPIFSAIIFLFLFAFAMPVLAKDPPGGGKGNCLEQHRREAVCTESTKTASDGTTDYCTSCSVTCGNGSTYTGFSCTKSDTAADRKERKDLAIGQAWRKGNQPPPKTSCIAVRPGNVAAADNLDGSVVSGAERGISNVVNANSLNPKNRLSLPFCAAW
jgi:hypothetical protein